MMLDQFCEARVLPARLDVTSSLEIQIMLPKRLAISVLPALFHRIDDRFSAAWLPVVLNTGHGRASQRRQRQRQQYKTNDVSAHSNHRVKSSPLRWFLQFIDLPGVSMVPLSI